MCVTDGIERFFCVFRQKNLLRYQQVRLYDWCRRPDLNRHGSRHYPLKIACLPSSTTSACTFLGRYRYLILYEPALQAVKLPDSVEGLFPVPPAVQSGLLSAL
jgi:hypothetical protein